MPHAPSTPIPRRLFLAVDHAARLARACVNTGMTPGMP
jgi:hypothetical protein